MPNVRATEQARGKRGCAYRQGNAILAAIAAAAILTSAASVRAVDFVGVVQTAALDQPRINLMLSTAPGVPLFGQRIDLADIFGPPVSTVNVQAYFDTGASGILISDSTATQLGIQKAQDNGQPVKFYDVGVAGEDVFHVSQPLYVGLAPYQPFVNVDAQASYIQQPAAVRMQVGPVRGTDGPVGDAIEELLKALTQQDINVVGMPTMLGKTVVIDPRHTNNTAVLLGSDPDVLETLLLDITNLTNFINQIELRTYVYPPGTPPQPGTLDTDPGIPVTKQHVKLSYGSFDRFTRSEPIAGPAPTLAHNPFIGPNPVLQLQQNPPADSTPKVKIGFSTDGTNTFTTEGSFLLDTGAAASMISKSLAEDLHVRYVTGTENTANPVLEIFDPANGSSQGSVPDQFKLTIGGIGGQATVAGFFLDSLLLRTTEGNPLNDNDPRHLKFEGAPVLVHDISLRDPLTLQNLTLDGIFGMNFLVASVNILGVDQSTGLPLTGAYAPGAFDWITFDEVAGLLGMTVSGDFFMAGDFTLDGQLTNADMQAMLDALKNLDAFQTANNLSADDLLTLADVDRSGVIGMGDVQLLMNLLAGGAGSGAQGVPEPSTWILLGIALPALVLARRNRVKTP